MKSVSTSHPKVAVAASSTVNRCRQYDCCAASAMSLTSSVAHAWSIHVEGSLYQLENMTSRWWVCNDIYIATQGYCRVPIFTALTQRRRYLQNLFCHGWIKSETT
eukprot:5164332-Pleurochrysis_carterae.AAC.3